MEIYFTGGHSLRYAQKQAPKLCHRQFHTQGDSFHGVLVRGF